MTDFLADNLDYEGWLRTKQHRVTSCGITVPLDEINPILFPFQRDIVRWAVGKGRCAVFLDTGLGKTFIQLEWARLLGKRTLIIAPLSVARQTCREAKKIGIKVAYVRSQGEISGGASLWITNYEMLDAFDLSRFGAVVLDESSILKALDGKTRKKLTAAADGVPYRLCCTATPAPNDSIELGNHSQFLGICTMAEMLAMFFINANKEHTLFDGNGTGYRRKGSNKGGTEWRLKHHAEQPFFQWLSSWAISMMQPSDLGYKDDGFILPELRITPHFVQADYSDPSQLFFTHLHGIKDRACVRAETLTSKIEALKATVATSPGQWIIWTGLSQESTLAASLFDDTVEVRGDHSPEYKAQQFERFQDGEFRILVTKPRIGGFGMNFQNAHDMAFLGMNDSWEQFYQSIRREWRYGQESPVNVHLILSGQEDEVYRNVMRKDAMANRLRRELVGRIRLYEEGELQMLEQKDDLYAEAVVTGDRWTAMLGDSAKRLPELADDSIDLSVYSPPFADLYTYTATERDLGNSRDWAEFFEHYSFIIREVLRVTKPGRLTCVHTSDIPAMAQRDGYIGVRDFPGAVICAYEREGWVFVGRAFVQKNPQAQAIRVKSKALLFVQMRKDSSCSRPALVDQVLLFRKPGECAVPVTPVANGEMDNEKWIEWAHGIWLGVHETDTLQYSVARAADDEKHICPLQLGTIERCIKLYSNPGETVLTPFMGIGSEAYQAIRLGRKAVGIELKESYFEVAVKNLRKAESASKGLFADAHEELNEVCA
ncbi:MAG: DNA methyltransferase [bacterium]